MGGVSETGNNRIMKPLIAVILFLTMTGFFTVKGQDRTVEIEGRTVIVLEGRKTDFSTPRRYIYRNDITPAYALVVGHYYTQEEVERAFGTPQKVWGDINYDFKEGSLRYIYEDFNLRIDYVTGLCGFGNSREDITFYCGGKALKVGDNIEKLTDDPDFQPLVVEQSKIYREEKTGIKSIGIAINHTGDDDWLYFSFWIVQERGIKLLLSGMGYQQIN